MSFGKKSILFAPVTSSMLPVIKKHFTHIPANMVDNIYTIMTSNLVTESLLFTGVISMIDRYTAGERGDNNAYDMHGAGIKLSAVRNDKTAKMQSKTMELLHDVIVELQMAGENYKNLQKYLSRHSITIANFHSCGSIVIHEDDEDAFYENARAEQFLRTTLDWQSQTLKNVDVDTLIAQTDYSQHEAEVSQQCYDVTLEMVSTSVFDEVAQLNQVKADQPYSL